MPVLETYEWSYLWWDKPSDGGKRILLVGDSITWGYRPFVQEHMADGVHIDTLATSKALDNFNYLRELAYVVEQNPYDAVHFNNGLHGFHMDTAAYRKHYVQVLDYLTDCLGAERVFVALSTPITEQEAAFVYAAQNAVVTERNQAVLELAAAYGIQVDDLYALVDQNAAIRKGDGVHYNEDGQKLQGEAVAAFLSARLK